MKKIILISALVALMVSPIFAQQFQKGTSAVNLGIGFGTLPTILQYLQSSVTAYLF